MNASSDLRGSPSTETLTEGARAVVGEPPGSRRETALVALGSAEAGYRRPLGASLVLVALAAASAGTLLQACGDAAEEGAGGVSRYDGNASAAGGSGNLAGSAGSANGSGASASSCTPGSVGCAPSAPESNNPNTPIGQSQTSPVAMSCIANSVSCNGSVLNRCDAAGTQVATQDCAATGATCGQLNGVASCLTPSCSPGALSCAGANTVSTCAADGTSSTTRCPDGTNCTGAGQCTPVRCNSAGLLSHEGNGGVTVYWFAQGTLSSPRQEGQDVNCGFNATRASNDDGGAMDRVEHIQDPALFGAMNLSEYAGSAACGACVELSRNGQNVTITVADSCNPAINNNGTCTTGHIDLSRAAFQQLTGQSTGDINGISWRFVPCEGADKVQFLLKKPADAYWNQFLVVNHRYPIVKAEVLMEDNRWVEARREDYNYWLPPEGDGGTGGDMGTYRVRVTDINGGIIEEQLELRAGLQGNNGQFDCQP
jgi:expansin (peptidoglycan-binding protein)